MSNQSIQLKQQLDRLLAIAYSDPKQITKTRGRLIRQLKKDLKTATNQQVISQITTLLNAEISNHQSQLNMRLQDVKSHSPNALHQLTNEFVLKIKKITNNIRQIKNSRSSLELVTNSLKLTGNVISSAATVAKAPIAITLKLGSALFPIVGRIIVQPLQIPSYLFAKLINPIAPYNSQIITNLGGQLGQMLSTVIDFTENNIRRL